MTRYVIIGNSAAAVGCVEGIRQVDRQGPITIISDEPHHTYSRPLISYFLEGKTDRVRMQYRGADFYEKNGVTPLLGKRAASMDPEKKSVTLTSGENIPYDKLLVAAGSRPFLPPTEGQETVTKAFTFMNLDSALALEQALTPESRVLIVGAGLIGLKCAEGIARRVNTITVVDMADRILPSILDEAGSTLVQAHLEEKGLTFHLSDCVAKFEPDAAMLKSGQRIPFDILVTAVGVRPNTSLIADAGGLVRRGVVTDEFCRTSLPDVYAAGDCAQSFDITTGQERVLALLPNAYMQGETAGIHMAGGGGKPYDRAIPMNAIGFFGLHIITAGSYQGEDVRMQKGNTYKRLFYQDDRLKGYILIGNVERAGIYTSLIREQTPLSSIDFDLICEKPQLMAFSKRARAKALSGAAG